MKPNTTTNNTHPRATTRHTCLPRARIGILLFAGMLSIAAHAQDPAIVGEATLVIGLVELITADGTARNIDRGTAIRVGDRLQTQAGGHVHLRFVDGGRLSIRPASNLLIEDYSHTPQQPTLSAIKFRLEEGVVRSITGSWGEAARERFRLNTPVAAIGIKGTDFIVKSEADMTSASVYTGAITLTPLAGLCSQTVGTCLGGGEKMLSASMQGQMLQFSRQQTVPQLVPLVDLLAHHTHPSPDPEVASVRLALREKQSLHETPLVESTPGLNLAVDSNVSGLVADIVASRVVTEPIAPVIPPSEITPPLLPLPPIAILPGVPISTPVVPLLPAQANQLVFAHYRWTPVMEGDTFTRSIEQALSAGQERITGNASYVLYRPPSAPGAQLASADASANFRLANSTAQFTSTNARQTEALNVSQAELRVDFTRSTFDTQLRLNGNLMGTENIQASGTIQPTGLLVTTSSNASLAGALTLDGTEAAYAFSKSISAGSVQGVTLWGR